MGRVLRCCAVSGGEEGDMKMIGALLDLNNKPVSQLLWFPRKAIAHRYDLNVPECRQNLWTRHSGGCLEWTRRRCLVQGNLNARMRQAHAFQCREDRSKLQNLCDES